MYKSKVEFTIFALLILILVLFSYISSRGGDKVLCIIGMIITVSVLALFKGISSTKI